MYLHLSTSSYQPPPINLLHLLTSEWSSLFFNDVLHNLSTFSSIYQRRRPPPSSINVFLLHLSTSSSIYQRHPPSTHVPNVSTYSSSFLLISYSSVYQRRLPPPVNVIHHLSTSSSNCQRHHLTSIYQRHPLPSIHAILLFHQSTSSNIDERHPRPPFINFILLSPIY